MADKKISALPAATVPLSGTEVLPIVQGGTTDKVSVSDLTAGRTPLVAGVRATNANAANFRGYEIGNTDGDATVFGFWKMELSTGLSRIASGFTGWGGALALTTNGVDRLSISSSGDVTTNTGNLVIGTAGKGIDFSANGGDVLTQYDEGTWNVNWNNLTGTPTSTVGRYTRIGRMVFFSYNTGAGAISGVGNNASFSLPFTPAYASVGAMIASNVTSAGNILIWTGSLAYPETFSGSEMVFSGMFYV